MGTYCASVNSHSPMGLVSRQWDAVDWACVLYDRRIENDRSSRSASSRLCAYPFYSSHADVFGKSHITQVCQPLYSLALAPCGFWLFPKLKSLLKGSWFLNATVTHFTSSVKGMSLPTDNSHGRMTVHGCALSSPLNDCQVTSRRRYRFFEIFKMDWCFQDNPRIGRLQHTQLKCATHSNNSNIHKNVSNLKMFYEKLTRISCNPRTHMMSEALRSSINMSGLNIAFRSLAFLRTREFQLHAAIYSFILIILIFFNNHLFTVNFGDK